MVEISGVNHFAISVGDLEESIGWYHRVFGFEVFDRSEIPGTGIKVCHMAWDRHKSIKVNSRAYFFALGILALLNCGESLVYVQRTNCFLKDQGDHTC